MARKQGHNPVAKVGGDPPAQALDHVLADGLKIANDSAAELRVEVVDQPGRINQVTKQHGQDASFRVCGTQWLLTGFRFERLAAGRAETRPGRVVGLAVLAGRGAHRYTATAAEPGCCRITEPAFQTFHKRDS